MLRAGGYDASLPDWRGIIRDDGWGLYHCTHWNHKDRTEARDCAHEALAELRASGKLPKGWELTRAARRAGEQEVS